jgi:lipoprotein NlpD
MIPSATAAHSLARLGVVSCLICLLAAGCVARRPAPVTDRSPPARPAPPAATVTKPLPPRVADTRPEFYTVKQGDTLYSIALEHGIEYRELAAWNNVEPSKIHVGQQLRLTPPASATVTAPLKTLPGGVDVRPLLGSTQQAPATAGDNVKTQPKGVRAPYSDQAYAQMASLKPDLTAPGKPEPKADVKQDVLRGEDDLDWAWPTAGKVVNAFNDSTSKGIAIAGKAGQPVRASAAGKVIFSGTGIRGLGKLIVIKHNKTFLSVYAHNRELLVKEGDTVVKGQKIAEMGNTDSDQVMLHFEIRRLGKPIDPAKLLPDRPT